MTGSVLLAATADGIRPIDPGGAAELPGASITSLAIGHGDRWAAIDERRIIRRANGAWDEVARLETGRITCLLPVAPDPLVGSSEAHLYRLRSARLDRDEAFDRVDGRADWYTPWGGPPDTRSASTGPDGTLYVNVHVGGIVRSVDAGASWSPTLDIDADVHQVVAHPTRHGAVLAATAWGLARSTDGADSWTFLDEGLHHAYCRAVAVCGDTVLISASTGPRGGRAAVYRLPGGADGPFERCVSGLPEWFPGNIDTFWLVANQELAAFAAPDGAIYRSLDAGRTWEQVVSGMAEIRALALWP
jgi:hypothetical protein